MVKFLVECVIECVVVRLMAFASPTRRIGLSLLGVSVTWAEYFCQVGSMKVRVGAQTNAASKRINAVIKPYRGQSRAAQKAYGAGGAAALEPVSVDPSPSIVFFQ